MKKFLVDLFKIEKHPLKGLMAVEKVVMVYLLLTLVLAFFMYTKLANPMEVMMGRVRIVAITVALWGVYRILPCRGMRFVRVLVQMALLAWWYPDTYELDRIFPNLDHIFATWEQSLFGCQPALLFSKAVPSYIFSELFDMGYAAYYPMIALTVFYYFICRYREFERAAFIVVGAFFIYYVIFVFVPVVGPTFYYKAVGIKTIAAGIFPNMHDYFNYHQDCLPSPGCQGGLFYELVEDAKSAGERPTAAFPSSHVGISTVCMCLLLHARNYKLLLWLLPLYLLLCCATVYIQAHYLVDALAGFVTGVLFFYALLLASRRMS